MNIGRRYPILLLFFLLTVRCAVYSAGRNEITRMDFRSHPAREAILSGRSYSRGEVLKILRKSTNIKKSVLKTVISSGKHKGKTVYVDNYLFGDHRFVEEKEGVNVLLSYVEGPEPQDIKLEGYDITGTVVLLVAFILAGMTLIGGKRSLYAMICLASVVFLVRHLYIMAIFPGIGFTVVSFVVFAAISLLLTIPLSGLSYRTFLAVISALTGITAVYFMGLFIYRISHISGFSLEEVQLLNNLGFGSGSGPVRDFYGNILLSVLMLGSAGCIISGIYLCVEFIETSTRGLAGTSFAGFIKKGIIRVKPGLLHLINMFTLAYIGLSFGRIMGKSFNNNSLLQFINMEFFHMLLFQIIITATGILTGITVYLSVESLIRSLRLTKR